MTMKSQQLSAWSAHHNRASDKTGVAATDETDVDDDKEQKRPDNAVVTVRSVFCWREVGATAF